MDYIDSTENDSGVDESLRYQHRAGYKYFYTQSCRYLSRKIKGPLLRKDAERETQANAGWLDTTAERSFEDVDVDPMAIERPKAPVFGGHNSDDEDDEDDVEGCFSALSQLSDSDDESISSGELWVEDVPCIDDADFEALLHSSPELADAKATSSGVMPHAIAADGRDVVNSEYAETFSSSFSSRDDSESREHSCERGMYCTHQSSDSDGDDDRICRIIQRGNVQVTVGNVPYDEDWDSSLWVSVYG